MNEIERELEDKSREGKMATMAIVTFLLLGIVSTIAISLIISTSEAQSGVYLVVEDVFFVADFSQSSTNGMTLSVSVFITNRGEQDAVNVEVIAFVVEKNSNLAMDKVTQTLGSIPKDKTGISEFPINVPIDESYTVRLIIFENGKIVVRGSGTITGLASREGSGTRYETDYDRYKTAGMDAAEADSFMIFPLMIGAVLVFLLLLVLLISKSSSKSETEPGVVHINGNEFQGIEYPQGADVEEMYRAENELKDEPDMIV